MEKKLSKSPKVPESKNIPKNLKMKKRKKSEKSGRMGTSSLGLLNHFNKWTIQKTMNNVLNACKSQVLNKWQ